jgi:hypothetical protein
LEDFAKTLWGDTQGLVLPYVTMMLVVIVGISVLALDGARYMSLQTQLQNGADALALAGAAELDRLPDAQVRAVRAITNLLTNATLFGNDASRSVQVSRIEFYARWPADDSRPMSDGASRCSGLAPLRTMWPPREARRRPAGWTKRSGRMNRPSRRLPRADFSSVIWRMSK